MPYGLYVSAEGAAAQSKRLEVIANNLANVNTVGFKRDLALFQARYAEATERGQDAPGSGSMNDLGGGIMMRATATDFGQGPLRETKVPTDLAISGPGFFQVRRGNERLLTRAGNFSLQPDGSLVTQDGFPVLTADGAPAVIEPELPFSINQEGVLEQPGGGTLPLAIVEPRSLGDLAKAGENLFRPLAAVAPLDPAARHVKAGFLEQSSVKAASETMAMIETSRAFEANANLIRTQDQAIGTLLGRVLRASA